MAKARETLHWLGMTFVIKDYVLNCKTCHTFDCDLHREIPYRSWQKVDLCNLQSYDLHLSLRTISALFISEMDRLGSINSSAVMQFL